MPKSLAAVIFLCISLLCTANAQITFQKSYGLPDLSSEAYDVLEIPGGYLLAGRAQHPATGFDGLLMQLDVNGNVVWEKTYDLEGVEKFKSVIASNDGGFVVLGESQTSADLWVLQVDANGNIQWQFRIDRPNGGSSGNRIMSAPGGFVLSGTTGPNNGISHGYLARIGGNNQMVWATTYQTSFDNLLTLGLLTDSLWYASGIVGQDASVIGVNPVNGALEKNMNFSAPGAETLNYIAASPDGNFIASGLNQPDWPLSASYAPWVQKMTPSGQVLWSYNYFIQGQTNVSGPLIAIPTGGYLVCPGSGTNAPTQDAFLMKIAEDGQVAWCHRYGNPNKHDWFLNVLPTSDGGFIAVGLTGATIPGRSNIYVVKLNAEGALEGCCHENIPVTVENFVTNPFNNTFTPGPFFNRSAATGVTSPGNNPAQIMLCSDTAPVIDVQCPANQVQILPSGASTVQVDYAQPTAFTNCTCDGLVVENLSGGISGSSFALGSHEVCWQASDACGNTQSCCFQITITEAANACDEKSSACFTWELLDRTQTASDEVAYRFRVTNHCASALKYAWFELLSGVSAVEPPQNSVYAPTPARQYQVRNPHFSPFFSVRFQALSTALHSGQSEIFRVVLPKQSQPDYLLAAAKLENGSYAEAHLNTFGCPIGQERSGLDRSRGFAELILWPNPARDAAWLDFTLQEPGMVSLELRDMQGVPVNPEIVKTLDAGQHRQLLEFNHLPAGIYLIVLQSQGNRTYRKVIVQR